jgi:hypothetical protein
MKSTLFQIPGEVLIFCIGPSDHCDSEASLGQDELAVEGLVGKIIKLTEFS